MEYITAQAGKKMLCIEKERVEAILMKPETVSYTHLDVYKRQVLAMTLTLYGIRMITVKCIMLLSRISIRTCWLF